MTVWLGFLILSLVGVAGAVVWLLMLAFRESKSWGLISTFVPFGVVAFVVKFWEESKIPAISGVSCLLLSVITGLGYSMATVNSGLGAEYGGADLWSDNSGFQDMAADESYSFPDDEAHPRMGVVEEPMIEEETSPSILDDVLDADPVLDEVEPELNPPKETPAPGPIHRQGRKRVALSDLSKLQGDRAVLILRSGDRVFCVLEKVAGNRVRVRKFVGGGSVIFTIDRRDIREIQVRQ